MSGTIDLLVVDPDHDVDRVTEALIEELLRSARNKGCTVVEAVRPGRSGGADPPGSGMGFGQAGPRSNEP